MDLSKWDRKLQPDANNEYFMFPKDEVEFKKAVFMDSEKKGLIIRIFTHNDEFILDRVVNSRQDDWGISPYIFISNTHIDGQKIRYKYRDCKIYAVPKVYEDMLPPRETNTHNKPIQKEDSSQNKGDTMNNQTKTPPLNQILYGPPGTGKTYHTIDKALKILGEETEGKDRAELKAKFDEYRQKGQIEFVTFHQSFSYEEFVEGIKPNVENEKMTYEVKDGIFKEICIKAQENLRQANIDDGQIDAGEVFDRYAEKVQEQLTKEKTISFGKNSVKVVGVVDFKNNANAGFRCTTSSGKTPIWITRAMVLRDYDNYKNGMIKEAKDIVSNHTGKKHAQSWWYLDFYAELKKFEEYSNIQVKKINKEPYILIIDEINRGNISKILGELITLIEPSKRIGSDEELRATLPYSNETFGVPSNLYIIGTMNTADRSIALLDTALRRRFEFVEMMPEWDNEHISTNCDGVNLQKLLKSMNERIEFLLDREHTIGHSFFIEVDSLDRLREVFKLKIIPLLQEYFYDDYAKIDAVLNSNGKRIVQRATLEANKLFPNKDIDLELEDKKIYKIKPFDDKIWDNPQTYINIYDGKVADSQDTSKSDENE